MPEGTDNDLLLYGYWRSSSAYRVRIALNLKGLRYRQQAVHLVRGGGEQHDAGYRAVNPLGLVPALRHGAHIIVQSTAICEYLEETFSDTLLLPADAPGRARVRSIVQTVCSEIQPLNNLGVMAYLKADLGLARGFAALESWLETPDSGAFCHGDTPTLADCFLVPQVYNAERFECDLEPYPGIREITTRCRALPAFREASPELQPDAD
jgi:maleylacetoacetate isomerase